MRADYNNTNLRVNSQETPYFNRTLNYVPEQPHVFQSAYDLTLMYPRMNPNYTMNPMMTSTYRGLGYDQFQTMRSGSDYHPVNLNRSRYFKREHYPAEHVFSHERNTLPNFNLNSEFQTEPSENINVNNCQIKSFNPVNYKNDCQFVRRQQSHNNYPFNNNKGLDRENVPSNLSPNSSNYYYSQTHKSNNGGYYRKTNELVGYNDIMENEHIHYNFSIHPTPLRERQMKPSNYFHNVRNLESSELNESVVAINSYIPSNVWDSSRYGNSFKRSLNNSNYNNGNFIYPYMEEFIPNYRMSARQYEYPSMKPPNDKEYVMNKYFHSLNHD